MTLSLERRAARWPDRTAVVDVSESRRDAPSATVDPDRYSYADLAALADGLAGRLAAIGVGPGDAVCALTRTRIESVALPFACWRLGAAYAPISHRLTPATAHRPVERIDPAVVVHERAQRDLVRQFPTDETYSFEDLERVDPAADRPTAGNDGGAGTPTGDGSNGSDRPALYLHDDETGAPVVAFTARAVERNCASVATTWGFGRTDRTFSFVPPSTYDGLLRATLPSLYVGATVLLDRGFDPGDAVAALERDRPTVLVGRTSEFRDLAAREPGDALASVDLAVCEGDFPATARERLLAADVAPIRADGRIECPTAFGQSAATARASADGDTAVGRPVLDCEARLVDDGAVIEGAGEGRLQLAGPVLAAGYVDRDGDNAAGYAERDADAAEADFDDVRDRADGADGSDESDSDDGVTERNENTSDDGVTESTGTDGARTDPEDGTDRGTFADGWFDTGERFRRREDGEYERA